MKALITGGSGFIGSHLAEYLLARGQEVFVIDDLSTGAITNISGLKSNPLFHYFINSIFNESLLAELADEVDVVYHLAASVGVKVVVENLVGSIENNVRGTELVLAMASKKKKKVLIASTSEVYGRGEKEVFRESDDLQMGPTTKSRWSYACSKALDEYLTLAYHQERKLPVTVVRLFNTVGERQTDAYGMVIPSLVRQALHGAPLTIHGDGEQSRCFCHVSDVVRALHQLMEHPSTNGQVYNIGSTQSITINELADEILRLTNSSSSKQNIPYTEVYNAGFDDITRRVPDISKIYNLIGWQPTMKLEEIITRIRDYIAKQDGISVTNIAQPVKIKA